MNTNRKSQLFILLALVAILLQSLTANVSAAQMYDSYETAGPAAKTDCEQVLEGAKATIARIDVPTTRADYAALDQIAECLAMTSASILIPVTSRTDSAPSTGYFDKNFVQFKLRQAESMSY